VRVLFPRTVDEAVGMLADPEGAPTPLAGGTDLLVHWPVNLGARDRTYLDLSGLERELRPIRWSEGTLTLGALSTYWDVIQDAGCRDELPLLIQAARQVGAIQIQSRGTWAGNVVNASPAADGVPVLMACDAVVVLRSAAGVTRVPLSSFYSGYKQMARTPDQLVTAIEVPRRRHAFAEFHKVGARRAQAITKVGAAIARSEAGWRIIANSVAPTVRRCRATEALLGSGAEVKSPAAFMPALSQDISPIDDIRSTADYRRVVLSRVLYHSLRGVAPGVR
jgi:CO/xanthine dehydrogenase FAD-binding subunit